MSRFCGAAVLGVLLFLPGFDGPLFGFTTRDAYTISSAFNSAFYVQSGTNGWFKDTQTGGVTYFWGQAEMIECVEDAYEWNSNATLKAQITNLLNGFIYVNGSNWPNYTPYNDDVMWAVIAFARGGVDTGRMNYCNLAKANFDACYARAYDTNVCGGMYWQYPNNASKNACVNGPGAIAAYLLYQMYGDTNYWNKASGLYEWERAVLLNAANVAIADNIGTNGIVNGGATTYNQGTFIGAAEFLGLTNDAALAANFTMENMTSGGILPEYGINNNNSGFNAIFWRWQVRFMRDCGMKGIYESWLQANAAAAWGARRVSDSLSWCQWLHPSPAGTNFYAWDCISSYEILQAADPTQGVMAQSPPSYPIDYYALDDGAATVAVDRAGGGNNGAVSGAAWDAGGRFNGCLSFNGSGASAQITNLIDNDFTVALWVRTFQSAASGQWHNGCGLVDGDVPGNANDFGAALVGGKFAFGVGNPDTTILSSASINDGAWHQCVAARQQSSGLVNLYVDGASQGAGVANRNTLNASARLVFGAISSGGGFFNGSLDDIRIFNRALAGDEVAALFLDSSVPPPRAPTNLAALAGNTNIQLTWSDASLATSYNVKRSFVTRGPYAALANVASTAFTDPAAPSNRTSYYVVSPVNAAGEGPNSIEVSATPVSLAAWFKADAITNIANGAGVGLWPDSSGNGFNAVQSLTANQPTFVAGDINGLAAVRFNAANSSYLWCGRPVQDDFTVICVFKSSQGIGTGRAFYDGAGLVSGEVSGVANDFAISLNASGQLLAGTGNPDTSINSSAGYNNGAPHLATFKRTKSSGALALYMDGSLVAIGTGGTQSLTSPSQLTLGAQQTLNNFFTGDIAEAQVYNAALSDADRLGRERALKCKYGLSGGQTPSAPTGLMLAPGNRQISLNWTMPSGASTCNVWRSTNGGAAYQLVASGLTDTSFVDSGAANGMVNLYEVTALDACGAGTASAAASVLLPLPVIGMNASPGALTLNWPGWAGDWQLCSATNLTAPATWNLVTNAVTSNNGLFYLTAPFDAAARFFRLASP